MKNFILCVFFILSSIHLNAQDETTENDPMFLKKMQGTWISTPNGGPWNKIVINGNDMTTYEAKPSTGRWNDERESTNEIIHLAVTSSYKVKRNSRSDYDGKRTSTSYSIVTTLRTDRNNHTGPYFSLSNDGKLQQYGLSSINYNKGFMGSGPSIVYRRVQSNFNPWN